MTLRFLAPVESASRDYPFLSGQVITIDVPTAQMVAALNDGRAEVLADAAPELATVSVARTPKKKQSAR